MGILSGTTISAVGGTGTFTLASSTAVSIDDELGDCSFQTGLTTTSSSAVTASLQGTVNIDIQLSNMNKAQVYVETLSKEQLNTYLTALDQKGIELELSEEGFQKTKHL